MGCAMGYMANYMNTPMIRGRVILFLWAWAIVFVGLGCLASIFGYIGLWLYNTSVVSEFSAIWVIMMALLPLPPELLPAEFYLFHIALSIGALLLLSSIYFAIREFGTRIRYVTNFYTTNMRVTNENGEEESWSQENETKNDQKKGSDESTQEEGCEEDCKECQELSKHPEEQGYNQACNKRWSKKDKEFEESFKKEFQKAEARQA